jgi:UDP-N-acetylglucosamine 4,6-dehydratase/5-epimerase
MFNNKNVLITGGTGSFGKAFCSHILKNYKPNKVVIFSRDELKQHEMRQEFSKEKYKCLRFLLGDVRDRYRLKMAFKDMDYVIHAAAQKHVEYAEYNPQECIKTNIEGATNVIYACIENNVKKVMALSTDKAANPLNLYGATKLVSDKLFIAANNISGKNSSIFSVVRYGNVLNSRGSVIPYFKKLTTEKSDFLPLTHKDMSRFIISIKEGVNFVIYSMKNMKGGEIFVPKIPSIKIIDLIKAINKNAKIKIIGLKPGEKLSEVLCPSDESFLTIEFKKHYLIMPTIETKVKKKLYFKNSNNEIGKLVKRGFEYNSAHEPKLSISQIEKLIKK